MRVILLDNIRGVGQIGDIKIVKDGYARNFLLPRTLAKIATKDAETESERLKAKRAIVMAAEQKQAQEVADRLKDFTLTLSEKASPAGTLFGAVTKRDLIKQIKSAANIELSEDMLMLKEHIKALGDHEIELDLGFDIKIPLKVTIMAEK